MPSHPVTIGMRVVAVNSMLEFATEHFVAQGDRVVVLGRCAFRYKKTGKVVWTQKADSWRFAEGKAVEYFEFYDTAQVHAAVAEGGTAPQP